MRKKTVIALIIPSAVLLALLAGGCGSGHKEGQEVPIASPAAAGNIQTQILSVSAPAGGPTVVTFTLFDENGAPLSPTAMLAADPDNRFRVTIGRIKDDGNYVSYCKSSTAGIPGYDASTPTAAQFATVGTGTYTYTFRTNLDNAAQTLGGIVLTGNRDRTHTVAMQIVRNTTTSTGKPFQQATNPHFNFRPDGGAVTVTREVVAMSNCNECHFKYGAHGGGRRDVALCVLCHYPGPLDPGPPATGNPLDLKDMIHKIHYGAKLPGNAAGGAYSIGTAGFADVEFPFMSGDNVVTGTPIECTKCHRQGFDTAGQPFGKDVARFMQSPTKNKCTTCHNTTTFDGSTTIVVSRLNPDDTVDNVTVTAVNHAGFVGGNPIDVTGANADNSVLCTVCHAQPGITAPYSSQSVVSAHTILEKSPAIFTGINFQIVSVTNARAGQAPTVRFRITTDNGDVIDPLASTSSFNLKLGYPAADYNNIGNIPQQGTQGQPFTKALKGGTTPSVPNGDGTYTVTFDNTIPVSASGVGVIGMEGRRPYSLSGFRTGETKNVGGQSIQYYFDMATGAQVTDPSRTRRRVVDIDKCLKCHTRLTKHGANRVNSIGECVICHNPAAFAMGAPSGTIDFKVFIHQIHTGDDLDPSQIVFDNSNVGVGYPQDRMNCLACHLDAATPTFGIPLPAGVQGTSTSWGLDNTTNADDPTTPPIQAACTACHGDQTFTAPHVANQTVGTTELCAQCHTTGLLLGPDFAHQPIRPFPVD